MKYFTFFVFLFLNISCFSQIKGKITSTSGKPLPYVNIYLEGSFTGTTSNEKGDYELEISQPGNYTLIFQFLGYKTVKKKISAATFPYLLNVKLTEETTTLDEVVLDSQDNPAHRIIKNAIQQRKFHKEKIDAYTANFYSRGMWRIKNAPEKILGQEVGDLGGSLDSTRSGIVYLSETISKISFKAPDNFKEKIIASKVSGNDNGFSLNSASEANLSFYNNLVDLNTDLISPIADYAFNYYDYKLEGIFYTENGARVNKIRVFPKRANDRVFSGIIYIVHDTWQIYGLELTTTGKAMQFPPIEEIKITQQFNFSEEEQLWVRISQVVDFSFKMFGISGDGRFIAVYSNYDFSPEFDKKSFGNEVFSFAEKANKKDSLFWKNERPVSLTSEERNDYLKKDSIQEIRESKQYLDSVDTVKNKFNLTDIAFGYTYRNSFEDWSFHIASPLFSTSVNTVQGFNAELNLDFRQNTGKNFNSSYWRLFSTTEYGFSEDRLRFSGGFQQKFNNISKPILSISGGTKVEQINNKEPISETLNGIATNFFERNYLKLYDLLFARVAFQQELFNGFTFSSSFSYEKRSPLYNNRRSFWVDWKDRKFTSNNPLQPYNYNSAPFEEHQIFTAGLNAVIHFDQEYLMYPNAKFNLPDNDYPDLLIAYEKGFASSVSGYNFDQLELGLKQNIRLGNKGEFGYLAKAGTFFNNKTVSYLDYRHFNGNQTHIGTSSSYFNKFNLLPYYALSTNRNYAEIHIEHDFKGWALGKIPLINQLNYNLILGTHQLFIKDKKTYSEYSIGIDNLGFGKFRFLRLDYVISTFEGEVNSGFIFGLKFLQVF